MLRTSEVIAKLNNLPGEKQFLENYAFDSNGSSFVADLLMIHESGVYLFKFFPEPGVYTGNELHYSWKFRPADGSDLKQITNPYIDQVNLGNAFKAYVDSLFACRLFCYTVFNDACTFTGDNGGIVGSRLLLLHELNRAVAGEMQASGKCYDAAGLKKIYESLTAKPEEERKKLSSKALKKKQPSAKKKKASADSSVSYMPKKRFNMAPLLAVVLIGFGVYYAAKTVDREVEDKKEVLGTVAVETAEAPKETVPASAAPQKIEPEYRKFGDEPNTLIIHNAADVSCQVFLLDGNDENVLVCKVPTGVYELSIPVGTWRTILAFEGSGPVDYGDIVSAWDLHEPIEIYIDKSR